MPPYILAVIQAGAARFNSSFQAKKIQAAKVVVEAGVLQAVSSTSFTMSGHADPSSVLDQLIGGLIGLNASRYLGAAGGVLCLYDFILTQADEVCTCLPLARSLLKKE